MLTVKGIGGGGSADVTNGILQEMYAAEGEIPANTFVEVEKRFMSDSTGVHLYETDTFDTTPYFFSDLDPKFALGITITRSPDYSIYLTSLALEERTYIQKNSVKVYSGGDWEIIYLEMLSFIHVSQDTILMI